MRNTDDKGYCLGSGARHVGHRHDIRDCAELRKRREDTK